MAKPGAVSAGDDNLRDIPPIPDHASTSSERMGVLSLTLSPSPVTRWILPARVRTRRHKDVVFVGNTYIQLREFHENGQLSDATAKLDLGTQIMGAKVISAKVEMVPRVDLITLQEYDDERFIVKGEPCPDDQPPQVIVLTTASNELIYAYARNITGTNQVEFVFAKRALLGDVSVPPTYMRYIAIDPECKVLAIASYSTCTVFNLKEVDELKTNIDAWDPRKPQSFQPYSEQRMFQIDGHILKMDFLRASEEEPYKAILLIIVVKDKATLLLPYVWDTREPLDQIQPMSSVIQSLPHGDNFPQLLIPSMLRRSFIIVTDKSVSFYDSIKSSSSKSLHVSLPSDPTGKHSWVQWAKPSRLDRYKLQKEDILLVRDDGYLMMLNRHYNPPAAVATNFSPGDVRIGVDSAVSMLPGPRLMGGDILIVGGSMCDGGVFHLRARQESDLLQNIPNISPIHDLAMIDASISKQKDARARRTFVTAGVRGTSSLNDLRYGYEAQIGWMVPMDESATIDRIWTIEHVATKRLFIITSHPEHTDFILLDLKKQQLEELDPDAFPGLHLNTTTFAVTMLPSSLSVQITPVCISVSFETTKPTIQALVDCICADIDRNDGTFAIACKAGPDYHVQVGLIREVQGGPSIVLSPAAYCAQGRPSCLALFNLQEVQYLAVGYLDGDVEILLIDAEGVLTSKGRFSAADSDTSAITSIVVFGSSVLPHALILTGTRLGKLKVSKVVALKGDTQGRIAYTAHRIHHISETPVNVVREQYVQTVGPACAFVQGGSRLDRVSCFDNEHDIDYALVNVWLTTLNDLAYVHPFVSAVQRVQHLESIEGGVPSHFVACATKEQLLFARLIEQEQVVPRRLNLNENGVSFMKYSKLLNKFVVANNPSTTHKSISDSTDILVQYPMLQFVDCDGDIGSSDSPTKVVLGTEQEKVCFIMPWEPTDGRNHFDLIMIGLNDDSSGRLGFISARKLLTSSTTNFKQLARYANRKLHAICAIDKSSFAISVGKAIVLMRLDITSKKWHEDGVYTLPSPALSLAAQGSILYAATDSHSMIILSWHKASRKWEKVLTDREAKNARLVLPFGVNGDHLLAAMANVEGTSVLAYPINQASAHKPAPLFEARMPLQLKHINTAASSWPEHRQYAFQGITFDGTIYVFQTLTYSEWKLLHFIEQLAHPDPTKTARRQVSLLSDKMARNTIGAAKLEKALRSNPRKMHINGDVLKRLVDKGPHHLRSLMNSDTKRESNASMDSGNSSGSKLEALAGPVLGEPDDVAAAVIVWMRRLLRATIF